jgi:hypothetical protein
VGLKLVVAGDFEGFCGQDLFLALLGELLAEGLVAQDDRSSFAPGCNP